MARNIIKIEPLPAKPLARKRVAAYARVSSGKEAMIHSLSAQISYYSEFIQKHNGWEYAGVYADEAVTGTKDSREEFQRLLADCRAGKIDMIITKSISRFARNTVTMLGAVRELKSLNVDVYFEKENIHSMSGDGELMLTILASFAQEESRSVSENCKWRIRKGFQEGRPSCASILGYKMEKGTLVIVPCEAEIVRMIFTDFLSDMSKNAIAKKLISQGFKGKRGGRWDVGDILTILTNEKYAGDMILQKAFNSSHIDKKKQINKGQLPMYCVRDSHEPIITREMFESVQEKIKQGKEKHQPVKKLSGDYIFTGKMICEQCGRTYGRKISNSGTKYEKAVWICPTFNTLGKKYCQSKQIPEDILISLTTEVMGLAEFKKHLFEQTIKDIRVTGPNSLSFVFYNNKNIHKTWANKSRKESWDEEAKQRARECRLKLIERRNSPCLQQEQQQ